MDAQLKAKWVEALRSGKYSQCKKRLTDGVGHCCLGVLADAAGLQIGKEVGDDLPGGYIKFDDLLGRDYSMFPRMNDDEGKSFSEIADYIEANL
jgi:hypothetical protein